jgi:hypothetical protein
MVETELVVAEPSHVAQDELLLRLHLGNTLVLTQKRVSVLHRLSEVSRSARLETLGEARRAVGCCCSSYRKTTDDDSLILAKPRRAFCFADKNRNAAKWGRLQECL